MRDARVPAGGKGDEVMMVAISERYGLAMIAMVLMMRNGTMRCSWMKLGGSNAFAAAWCFGDGDDCIIEWCCGALSEYDFAYVLIALR